MPTRPNYLSGGRTRPQALNLPDPCSQTDLKPFLSQISTTRPYYKIPGAPVGADWTEVHRYKLIASDKTVGRWPEDRPPCDACGRRNPKTNFHILCHGPTGTVLTMGEDCAEQTMGRPLQKRSGTPRGVAGSRRIAELSDLDKPLDFRNDWRVFPVDAAPPVARTQWVVLKPRPVRIVGAAHRPSRTAVLTAPTRYDAARLLLWVLAKPTPKREADAAAYARQLWIAIDPAWFDTYQP